VKATFLLTKIGIAVSLAAMCVAARADVVTLTNGKRIEGRAGPAPGNPDAIRFTWSTGEVEVDRSRIRLIEEEPEAVDWLRIGDQHFSAGHYEQAQAAYRKSKAADPAHAEATERLRAVEVALRSTRAQQRREQVEQIDRLLEEAAVEIEAQQFENAHRTLTETVPDLGPEPRHSARMRQVKIDLYRAWAHEREDKLRPEAAARHLQELLRIDPTDRDAYASLMAIWDKMPEKSEQVVKALRAELKVHPEDVSTRKRLADKLFERGELAEAGTHYETLCELGGYGGSEVEARLVDLLDVLYRSARDRREYDAAIDHYKRLQGYSPRADDWGLLEL